MKKLFLVLMLFAATFLFSSCLFIKPYDKPEYVQIDTNETAFVIDLFAENDQSAQATLTSEDYYKSHLLNEKLVQIPHKWVKTGRMRGTGKYISKLKVVAVSNSPITGTWEDDIKVETKGSQGFTVPMKYAIRVTPADSGRFLSKFPADIEVKGTKSKMISSPENVANNQFKNVVAAELSKEFHKYEYKDVLPNRDEIVAAAIENIKVWAEEFGITIDNLAVWNGMIPDDATLQNQMDEQAKLAAQVETEKKRQDAEVQKKRNEIELQKLETERIEAERKNREAQARTTVSEQQILAQTSNIELARKQKEQEIANLKLKGEAEAEAIKIRAKALENIDLPKVITSNDLKVLGLDSLIKEATSQ
jgi:PBP1b-binding outer membrane lipoprotein LpoB